MDTLEFRLLNDFQRDFPLVRRPFAALAARCAVSERDVLDVFARLCAQGAIGRIGAVFAPRRIGASTLIALAVPEARLARVAGLLDCMPGVNHSYEREHAYNLWAVATAEDERALAVLLARIEHETGLAVLDLPLLREYRIDLGFDLSGLDRGRAFKAATTTPRPELSGPQRRLLCVLQDGLELVAAPYARLAARAGVSETEVFAWLSGWIAEGTIRRFGVIVRHHELGYRANAMAVWNVPDAMVDTLGSQLALAPEVTLAYRRRRQWPVWPYNLFCMIHGKERAPVHARLLELGRQLALDRYPHAVLFSRRRFKQTGARYFPSAPTFAYG